MAILLVYELSFHYLFLRVMINYLCLDNEADSSLRTSLDLIQDQVEGLSIILEKPLEYDAQLVDLAQRLGNGDIQGLILDLRLDDQFGDKAKYRAPTIAQELRTRSSERIADNNVETHDSNEIPPCPLVLWSTDKKLADSYRRDDTSHDLFEFKIFKDRLAEPDHRKEYALDAARKLIACVNGYQKIIESTVSSSDRADRLLELEPDWSEQIDPRIFAPLNEDIEGKSVHEQARYIVQQLLNTPNSALIPPKIVAARLGVDPIKMSVKEIKSLVDSLLPEARYKGIFSEGWPCWWSPKIEAMWSALDNNPGPLLRLTAEKRVAFINKKLGANLQAAQKIKYTTSSVYTTICQVTGEPLAPVDGFATAQHLYPWQLPEYVSLVGMLGKDPKQEYPKLDPLELERFNEERESYPETRRQK